MSFSINSPTSFGISPKSLKLIIDALKNKEEVEKACIFGSRSIGNYKKGSDVDIVLFGEKITEQILSNINSELNERLPLPYYFDLVHYESLKHDGLKEHIDQFGKELFSKLN